MLLVAAVVVVGGVVGVALKALEEVGNMYYVLYSSVHVRVLT